jgi:hypothetical protein
VVDTRSPVEQNLRPLNAYDSSGQPSGAYIFRPSEAEEKLHPTSSTSTDGDGAVFAATLTLVQGDGVVEVWQNFSAWASQVVRLRRGQAAVEFSWTVGPVPVDKDGVGKEVVSRFRSELQTGGKGQNKCYTDSNGREFMERQFNYRPTWDLEVFEPVTGNYFPVTAAMYIRDEDAALQLSVLPDRAQAAASLADGEMVRVGCGDGVDGVGGVVDGVVAFVCLC